MSLAFFDTILIAVFTSDAVPRSQGLPMAVSVRSGLGMFRSKVGQSFVETVLGDLHRIEIAQAMKK